MSDSQRLGLVAAIIVIFAVVMLRNGPSAAERAEAVYNLSSVQRTKCEYAGIAANAHFDEGNLEKATEWTQMRDVHCGYVASFNLD